MVTDAQVRLMRQKRMNGNTQAAAAAASSMSLRTAREWDAGPVPSATEQLRDWRTRPDPFAAVWPTDVEPLLLSDTRGVLEAKLVLELLRTRYPKQFHPGQARTLQRRFRDWRAQHGPEPEVFFGQVAVPGREAAIDFTHATDLGVLVAGDPFPHLLFEFVLSYSHWTFVAVAFGETFRGARGQHTGPVFAGRILKYRNLLGGYYRVEQLSEIYGMKQETVELVSPFLYIDTLGLKKLYINLSGFRDLLRHPYLEYEDVKALMQYMDIMGSIASMEEIRSNGLLADSTLERIAPYLEFGD